MLSPGEPGAAAGAGGCRERVNRAIDHVLQHLDRPLRLAEVASVAELSPFHFHRVFRALVGEPLGRFVRRLRLERALHRMARAPGRSLTEIALESGFASSSDFSRGFKQHYGVAPRDFDLAGWRDSRRGDLRDSMQADGHDPGPRLGPGENPDGFRVELLELPPRTLAYIRVLDPYRGDRVHARRGGSSPGPSPGGSRGGSGWATSGRTRSSFPWRNAATTSRWRSRSIGPTARSAAWSSPRCASRR